MKQTASCKNLVEVKLSVKWIREMSVLFVSGLDMGRCRAGTKPDVVLKYAKMIAKEWQDDRGIQISMQFTHITTNGLTTSSSSVTSESLNSHIKAHLFPPKPKIIVYKILR